MSAKIYPVLKSAKTGTLIDNDRYKKWYQDSVEDPEKFWGKHGKRIDWFKPFTKVKNTSFDGKVSIRSQQVSFPATKSNALKATRTTS